MTHRKTNSGSATSKEKVKQSEELLTFHIFAEDYSPSLSWELARWCKRMGADEWTAAILSSKGQADVTEPDALDTVTASFRLPDARRRQLTSYRHEEFVRLTNLWRLTSASLAALQSFLKDGIFTDGASNDFGRSGVWLEDPIFYRRGELMLGVVSHEHEGVLRVTSTEQVELAHAGFPFRPHGLYVGY